MSINEIITLLLTGIVAGFISGSLGVGGGVIIIPAMLFLFGMTQHQAQGISIGLLSLPVAMAGAYNYYKEGHINIKYVIILAVVFSISGYFGSMLAVKLPGKMLKKIFGVFLLIAAIKMIFSK